MKLKPFVMAALCSVVLIVSCKKDKPDAPVPPPPDVTPKITSINPAQGGYGTIVTITGSNFNSTGANNTVKINGASIPVQTATATSLTIQLPSLLATGSGAVEVTTSKGTATGSVFTYTPDVFISGNERISQTGLDVAKYWKNDSAVTINNGVTEASSASILVSGNEVIVGGVQGDNPVLPTIWRNGIATILPSANGLSAVINAIAMSGTDVYAAGLTNTNTYSIGTYWRNGTAVPLNSISNSQAEAKSIAVSGSDVYVAGYEYLLGELGARAAYWRNGNHVLLTDGSASAEASAIALSGNDVYLAGFEVSANKQKAKVWRNNVATTLTTGNVDEVATAIAVVGNDVYVGGDEYNPTTSGNICKFWKNGVATTVTDGTHYAKVTGIAAFENNVYMSGYEQVGNYVVAVYWKNGIRTVLTDTNIGNAGQATGIYLR